jgi:predicted metal-dependent hydrolase
MQESSNENESARPEIAEPAQDAVSIPDFSAVPIRRSSRRHTIGIKLTADGKCQLLAPAHATLEQLQRAYEHFIPWLKRQLMKQQSNPVQPFKFRFAPGGEFFFRGQKYQLAAAEQPLSGIVLANGKMLVPPGSPAKLKILLEKFYRQECEHHIAGMLDILLPKLNLEIEGFSINSARKRFGSCSSRKRLNFSWQLMMYPDELIELVILHELAHLKEMNHSPAFYRVLSSYLPDHRLRSQKLKLWTHLLSGYPE